MAARTHRRPRTPRTCAWTFSPGTRSTRSSCETDAQTLTARGFTYLTDSAAVGRVQHQGGRSQKTKNGHGIEKTKVLPHHAPLMVTRGDGCMLQHLTDFGGSQCAVVWYHSANRPRVAHAVQAGRYAFHPAAAGGVRRLHAPPPPEHAYRPRGRPGGKGCGYRVPAGRWPRLKHPGPRALQLCRGLGMSVPGGTRTAGANLKRGRGARLLFFNRYQIGTA